MLPAVGCSSPAISRRTVDFPQPEGPKSMQNSPSATSKETLFKIWFAPNCFDSRRTAREAISLPPTLGFCLSLVTPNQTPGPNSGGISGSENKRVVIPAELATASASRNPGNLKGPGFPLSRERRMKAIRTNEVCILKSHGCKPVEIYLDLFQPFTAPAAKPRTIPRWNKSVRRINGNVASVEAAAISPQGIVYSPGKRAMPTGSV